MLKKLLALYYKKKHQHYIDKLTNKGMVVGNNCNILPGVKFDESHCWLITIKNSVTISPQARILAHDASTKKKLGYTKIGPVHIADNVFIGAEAIILPGVTIGENSIIGAGSVVTKDVHANVVCAGHPAKELCEVGDYFGKHEKQLEKSPRFGKEYTVSGGITKKQKNIMKEALADGIGYIV
jgi:maltose O-acetyltransferase